MPEMKAKQPENEAEQLLNSCLIVQVTALELAFLAPPPGDGALAVEGRYSRAGARMHALPWPQRSQTDMDLSAHVNAFCILFASFAVEMVS